MAGSFEVGSIFARIGIDDSDFVKEGRALLAKAKRLGKSLNEALKTTVGPAVAGATAAATGAAAAATSVGLGAAGAGIAGTSVATTKLDVDPDIGGTEIIRRAEEFGKKITLSHQKQCLLKDKNN